jgi:sterol desaturase/sphingolipid hydroxylase (fatty acid hydroxylase superfamily)
LSAEQQHPSADARARENKRARLQTPTYRLSRHVGLFVVLTLVASAVGLWLAGKARARDLWIVPAYLVAANVVEYLVHRLLMHRPLWPRRFYRGHTLGHHRAFHHDSMEVGSWRELELVMMPRFTMLLFFVGMAPIVALVGWTLGHGAAGLWTLTAIGTFVSYEVLHALYHLPLPTLRRFGFLGSRAFNYLYRHHLHHHRLARMRWVNFNISLPLSDRVFGTLENEKSWRAEKAGRRGTRPAKVEVIEDEIALCADPVPKTSAS